MNEEGKGFQVLLFIGTLIASAIWWGMVGAWQLARMVPVIGVSVLAASLGFLVGFLFSAFEGEQESIGKVRDWLVGAVSGVALSELAEGGDDIYRFFAQFRPVGGPETDVAVLIATAMTYFTVGFFFMYFNRELWLNPLIRERRKQKETATNLARAADVTVDPARAADNVRTEEKRSEEVSEGAKDLVEYVERKRIAPQDLPRQALLKTASAYIAAGDYPSAVPYLRQAQREFPNDAHVALQLALAVGETGNRMEAVRILRELVDQKEGLPAAYKLLGYFLLWFPKDLEESVRYTTMYIQSVRFDDGGAFFNLACAYAQMFHRGKGTHYRDLAIAELKRAVKLDEVWRSRARELDDEDFIALRDDPEFRAIIDGEQSAGAVDL